MNAAPGRVATVTGAAGGVGGAVVTRFRAAGYRIVAVDVSASVADLAEPDAIVPVCADAGASGSAAESVGAARGALGRLDVLVNNAGRFLSKPIIETSDEEFDSLIHANVRSAFLHAREALPLLLDTGGSIVNTSSISGFVGISGRVVYAMTKAALLQLTRVLAIEYAAQGVRVNAVAPGAIATEFTREFRVHDPDPVRSRQITISNHPIGRVSTPDEVARAIEFLAHPDSGAITGTVLSVDGGYLAR